MSKIALISGISGQDGRFLSKLLINQGYEVHGVVRRTASNAMNLFDRETDNLHIHYADMQDSASLIKVVLETKPDEVYNLAAQSHVGISFQKPEYTVDVTGLGAMRLMSACHMAQGILNKPIKFYQASSSEMFGYADAPQNEKTPFHPRSPYACAKVFAHHAAVNFREAYNMFICSGILFNHESEYRGTDFVTRKITKGIADIIFGRSQCLCLGNLDAKRDWGYARDYVEAMWLMLQQERPDDYVIATGKTHTVRDFVDMSFAHVGVTIGWEGHGDSERGVVHKITDQALELFYGTGVENGSILVRVSPEFYRPAEVPLLLGDSSKAQKVLGWEAKTGFAELVQIMMDSDLGSLRR